MISCLTSAFAGVYFEKILKGKNTSIWVKNIQLSMWSLLLCVIEMSYTSSQILIQKGFFNAYTIWVYFIYLNKYIIYQTWACIFIRITSGILVAIVIKYADNLLKLFAAAISIVLSCICSVYLYDLHLSFYFVIGTCFVIVAALTYGFEEIKMSNRYHMKQIGK